MLDGLLRLTDVIAKSEKPGGIVVKDVTLLGLRKEVRIDDSSSASSSSRTGHNVSHPDRPRKSEPT